MLVNVSNHPHLKWTKKQQKEAQVMFGEVVDYPFPQINPFITSEEVDGLVEKCIRTILSFENTPDVMVQGEYVLTYRLVDTLKKLNIRCFAAESVRYVEEVDDEQGDPIKVSFFKFQKFLEY